MKKNQLFGLVALLIVALICFSCNKNDVTPPPDITPESDEIKRNEATLIYDDSKNIFGWIYKLKIFKGHTIDQCGGKCIKIFGTYGHIDCRGFGNVCEYTAKAQLTQNEDGTYTLILEDADDLGQFLEFDFPDRSLFITNPQNAKELWLNIGEQLLVRENYELPFKIENVWFSEEQELDNR
jgi:hypothetical protein